MVQAVVIDGANITIAKDQDEYLTLRGRSEMVPLGPDSPMMVRAISVAYQLELAEIDMLLKGGVLIYRQLQFSGGFSPMSLHVEPAADPIDMRNNALKDII